MCGRPHAHLRLVELRGEVNLVVAGLEVGAGHDQALVERVALQTLALLGLQRLILILLLLQGSTEAAAAAVTPRQARSGGSGRRAALQAPAEQGLPTRLPPAPSPPAPWPSLQNPPCPTSCGSRRC